MKAILLLFFISVSFVTDAQIITTVAGTGVAGHTGDGGPATAAEIHDPFALTFDASGNYFLVEAVGNRIRKVTSSGIISTIAGGGSSLGDGGPATAAQFNNLAGVAFDTFGNIYVADGYNNRIRKIDAITTTVTTIAGNGTAGYSGDSGPATAAMMSNPFDLCFDQAGNLFFSDNGNSCIRKISTSGIITTIAGTTVPGFSGDGGPATAAEMYGVLGICIDTIGNLFLADRTNSRVRKVNTAGIITTIAGNGLGYSTGDGGPATAAQLNPERLKFDDSGNLYISCIYKYCIRKIDAAGIIHTVAGDTIAGYSGDNGSATAAQLDDPIGIAFDPCGNLYIADEVNNRIRKVIFDPLSVTPAPSVSISSSTSDTVCSGTPVTYTAAVVGSGSVSTTYQWYVNGVSVSTSGSSYSYTPANGDSISCKVTSTNPCAYPGMVKSNTIHMVVTTAAAPSIHITASTGDTTCPGTSVTFTAAATGAGASPGYQWVVNGSYVGSGSSSYSYTPANGDSIRCMLTAGATPCTPASTISSNTIIMVVGSSEYPGIVINVSPKDSVCTGTPATFTASISLGGVSPAYQWKVNGINSGTSLNTYTYTPANNDSVRCILTSSASCALTPTAGSNTINMVVDAFTVPAITLTGIASAPVGTVVTVTATVTGAGSSYNIHWYNNSILFNTTTVPTVTYTKATGTDNITATVVPVIIAVIPNCYDSTTSAAHLVAVAEGVNTITATQLHIYPNPANDILHIDGITSQSQYNILSIVGTIMQQGTLNQGNTSLSPGVPAREGAQLGGEAYSIPIQSLPAGMYMVEVINNDGNRTVNKIIKQ